ncbi:hypothetical protein FQN54_003509 [Arachnomyces sp. PD_36]|nr:hypothetical protein FQN54_003509 [Arachnomyces sp. PD_36]
MEPPLPATPSRDGKDLSDSPSSDDHIETSPDHETVATLPLQNHTVPTQILTPTTQRLTQPTQIIEKPTPKTSNSKPPTVQVYASSPLSSTPASARPIHQRGGISSAMAPAGTQFRPPPVARKRSPVIDLSDDDEPAYRGGSSDDDLQFVRATDIKPAKFGKAARDKVDDSPVAKAGMNRFKEITASAVYDPDAKGSKRSLMEASGERPAKKTCQAGPSRAQPIDLEGKPDMTLDQIQDYHTRVKVRRMLGVFPQQLVSKCLSTLLDANGNYEMALAEMGAYDEKQKKEKEAQSSEDELSMDTTKPTTAATAKQHIKARGRIQDKWASQNLGSQKRQHSPPAAKPRKRLMRGSRNQQPDSPVQSPPRSESPEPIPVNSDSDSELSAEPEVDEDLPNKVLNFFNTCTTLDLADIASINEDIANKIIAHRPFRSLDSVRKVTDDDAAPASGKRKSTKRPIGEKIVEKCLDMWTGYEAVDSLVAECEKLGKPIAEKMKQWGVDVFGAKKEGELELTSLGTSQPTHDSGIGTPESQRSSDDDGVKRMGKKQIKFLAQPAVMSESIKMKDYQVVGLNWLALLYEQGLSCILADDMGLGKTCQVISFLSHLLERGIKGPHLVVVPSSTLENWLREFSVFCPGLSVMPYYAGQSARAGIREQIEQERDDINVVITTYTVAKAKVDAAFLRSVGFNACIYDEGHMLKNSKSLLYEKLIRIPAKFRLLLTGTPLQNNLQELASLLGFIMPNVFKERREDLEYVFSHKAKAVGGEHAALLSAQRIARAKSMLAPFVLRRKKHQVIDLPAKTARVEYCEMDPSQVEIYKSEVERVRQLSEARKAGKKTGSQSANVVMKLRQAAIHPLLYRRLYDEKTLSRISKACISDEKWAMSDPDVIYTELVQYSDFEVHSLCTSNPKSIGKFALKKDEWMNSGKVAKLCELLKKFKENGDRALIFSQFTMVMDILEHVLETIQMRFFRLDGRTSVEDRQSILDAFHEQEDVPVFLLSTKAGGAGINLACANKVVIFDSSFNPQEDVQAENRAHRVGQTREVEVIRLVTTDTIEEQIYALGQTKLVLDQRVAGEECVTAAEAKKEEEEALKTIEDMVIAKFESTQKEEEKAT